MRVVFMGTPEFAIPSLEAIVNAGYDVPLVVSVPDKPKGRGRKLAPSPVKARAEELGLRVATPERLRDPEFLEELASVQLDVLCVVAFRILPEAVYSIPSKGSFNLHGSLLPKYRGAAPINRAVMAGDDKTGVTTFFLKKKVDTGDVILRKSIGIGPDMTAGELHDVMMEVGAQAVVETLRLIESGTVETSTQDDSEATPAPKIFKEDCVIDWTTRAIDLHNMIRGLSPYPAAHTLLSDETYKMLRSRLTEAEEVPSDGKRLTPGEILIVGERLFVGTGDDALEILELQRQGKRAMSTADFLHGGHLESGKIFG